MRKFLYLSLILICWKLSGQTILPKVEKQDESKCKIAKIDFKDNTTVVYINYNNGTSGWACVNDKYFIEEIGSGVRLPLLSVQDIAICPEKREFTVENQDIQFVLTFSGIPKTDLINIIEDETKPAFNFYGVELNRPDAKSNITNNGRQLETYYGALKILTAILLCILLAHFLRKRFKWYLVFGAFVLIEFIVNLTLKFIFASLQHEFVSINFGGEPFFLEFFENIGYCIVVSAVVFPFYFRKSQKKIEVSAHDPNKTEDELRIEFEEKLKEIKAQQITLPDVEAKKRPVTFYLTFLFCFLFILSLVFIFIFSDQINSHRNEMKLLYLENSKLTDQLKECNKNVPSQSYLQNEFNSSNCAVTEDIIIENKLDFSVRIFISTPLTNDPNDRVEWEEFRDFYYLIEPGYRGTLTKSKSNEVIRANVIRFYLTDEKGNFVLGSKQRPIFYSPCNNSSKGLVIF